MFSARLTVLAVTSLCAQLIVLSVIPAKAASEADWPRQINVPQGEIIIYQPQLEYFEGIDFKARAAIAVIPKDETQPSYGAVWIKGRLVVDRDRRLASITDLEIPRARFAGSTPEQEKKLTDFLVDEMPNWELPISMDRLLLSIKATSQGATAEDQLANISPPIIYYSEAPAILILISGEAKLKSMDTMKQMRVVNSPYQIFFDPDTNKYYINGGKKWFSADELRGQWTVDNAIPENVSRIYSRTPAMESPVSSLTDESPPIIIVPSAPSELIVFDGSPKFESLVGEDLLYASNTESNVFKESQSSKIYVLLAGRWFRSGSLDGPWETVASNTLPECFARIPPDSSKGSVLAHISGTTMANDAVMDAQVPQTAAIHKEEPILQVSYDGEPVFKSIEGSGINYAENSPYAIVEVKNHYYCCHFAVWYDSETPQGPWRVCDSVPDEIYNIPPSCPLYYVRFVRVYTNTPDVVYVGYTPGYLGSYVVNGTVVYGTGYAYQDWFRTEYVARPLTWGLGARYDSGRAAWELMTDYVSPGGSYMIKPGSLDGGVNRVRRWSMAGWWWGGGYQEAPMNRVSKQTLTRPEPAIAKPVQNVYDYYRAANKLVSSQTPSGISGSRAAKVTAASSVKGGDLFVDNTGAVYRRTAKGWEKREVADWIESRTTDSTSQAKLDQEYRMRQQGAEREQKFK